jgi:multidrug efflux system membrane fusion protein
VRVAVQLDMRNGAIAVPTTAVQNGQEGSYVYVVDTDRNAHVRTVTVGQPVGDLTVIEHGLEPGEQVVVDGQSRLVPGAKVEAKPQPTPVAQRSGGSGVDE